MYYNYNFTVDDLFAFYIRKSQADDPSEPIELTLSKHKARLLEAAKKYNISSNQIVFFEEVVSGDTLAERPQAQALLKEVNNNNFKGVFVVAVDRLSRGDSMDQGIINNSFYYSNTLIITPDKIFDITNNEMDREQLEFGLFMSKREYNLIKKRMYQGRLDNVKKGFFVGSTPPFGYDKIRSNEKGYILVPNENAKFVKEMFNMILNGDGTVKIAKYLNSIGIIPKRSTKWSGSMVRSILKRPVYCGIIQWGENTFSKKMEGDKIIKKAVRNKNYMAIEGKHEPIIEKEVFDEVQKIMKNNYRSKVPNSKEMKNPFAGLIICGYCLEHEHIEKKMKRKPPHNKKSKNGKNYYAAKESIMCNNIGCKNVSSLLYIVEDKLMNSLSKILKEYKKKLNDYEIEYESKKEDHINILNYLYKEIEKNRKQLHKAQEFYELGDYTREEFLKRKKELNGQYNGYIKEKEILENENNYNKIEIIKKQIPKLENCINNYYKLKNVESKNKLLKSIIEKIIYTKEESASHDKDLIDKFELKIELKI